MSKTSFLWGNEQHNLRLVISILLYWNMRSCFTTLEWKEMIHKKIWLFFHFFRDFNLHNFCKISRGTGSAILYSPQTFCLSAVNKKVIFQGFMTKYLQGFEFKFQKTASYRHIFGHFLLTSAEELFCFTFLFMELLADYVGAIVSSFKLFGLVKLSLGLFIKNTSKSNWIPGLQTVWSLKLTSLKLLTSLFWNLRCIR